MDILFKVQSNASFEATVDSLKASLAEVKFGVLWELNFKDKLEEKGLTFDRNVKVLEVCNPPYAKQALETQIEVASFLPCKILVYEEQDHVVVALPKPTTLIGLIGNETLTGLAEIVETTLSQAITKAVST
jgi:uncharacterized protein (DUF302 family)